MLSFTVLHGMRQALGTAPFADCTRFDGGSAKAVTDGMAAENSTAAAVPAKAEASSTVATSSGQRKETPAEKAARRAAKSERTRPRAEKKARALAHLPSVDNAATITPPALKAAAASPAAAAASDSQQWIVPDLAITAALLPRIVDILISMYAGPDYQEHLSACANALLDSTNPTVATVNAVVEHMYTEPMLEHADADTAAQPIRSDASQLRRRWRSQITELVDALARDGVVPPSSKSTTPPQPENQAEFAEFVSIFKRRAILKQLRLLLPNVWAEFARPMGELEEGLQLESDEQQLAENTEEVFQSYLQSKGPGASISHNALLLRAEFRRLFAEWFGVQAASAASFVDTQVNLIGAPAVAASAAAPCSFLVAASSSIAAAASSPPLDPLSSAADRVEHVAKMLALQQARQQSTIQQCFAQLEAAASAQTAQQAASLRRIAELESERSSLLSAQQANEHATAARFDELSAAHSALLSAHSEANGASQQRISELETERVSLLARLIGVKQEQLDTEEECIKAEQLKRMGERQLVDEREKLRITENQLHQQTCDFAAHRAHLASVAEQLSARRREVSGLESEHAELASLLHTREDAAQLRLSGVKLERDEAKDALEQTTQHKRKAEEERDDASKRARDTEVQLEQKTEELEQLNCVICEESRASILYLPCAHAPCCDACDDDYQGGPRRAAAGPRTCPICRADIASTAKPYIGH